METNDKLIGKLLDDRYLIEEAVGEGGMAVVYRAMDNRLNRYVAVKVMREELAADEEFKRRFCAESQAVAMLSHPNIVAVYDVSHSDAMEYIVMELVEGITLKQYMEKRGALLWKEALHFSKQIVKALAHAHERGIIHRDIKPQNIMLLQDGTIKVGDFGIAALENELNEDGQGQAIGSIHYIAPEQARGEYPDARSDLYSLGVVLYEMLTGVKPYTGNTLGEIAVKHMNVQPEPIHDLAPEVPEELERITLKAMEADISLRYQSANEMLEDLDRFTQSQLAAESGEAAEPETTESQEVAPVRAAGELSREKYRRRRRRAGQVSYLMGTFGVLAAVVALFAFLWDFWLGDVFNPAERITLPNFVGSRYEALVNNPDFGIYSFEVIFVVDTEMEPGIVLSQSPDPDRSMMLTADGIDVELTVSSGVLLSQVPDVINTNYRDAANMLRESGFNVEIENAVSDSVTKDYVINVSPSVGEALSPSSTVYLTVSSGPQIAYVNMPNLIGLTENAAISQIENSGLSYGGSERQTSDLQAGTVIGQSIEAHTQIEEHTKILLRVSNGPDA